MAAAVFLVHASLTDVTLTRITVADRTIQVARVNERFMIKFTRTQKNPIKQTNKPPKLPAEYKL